MSRFRSTRKLALLASFSAALALPVAAYAQVEVTAAPLPAPDLWSTPGRDTGLSPDLWRGAGADLARAVLPKLGAEPIQPALRRLAIRVLATGAAAPEGGAEDVDLAAERAFALTRLGAPDAALAVLSRTPRVEASEPLSRARAEAALYLRDPRACETERALQAGRGGTFWLKLRAYCQLESGDAAAAQVTFDLWRQTGDRAPAYAAGMTDALGASSGWRPVFADAITTALSRRRWGDFTAAIDAGAPAAVAALAAERVVRVEPGSVGEGLIPPLGMQEANLARATARAEALGLMTAAEAEGVRSDAAPAADARPDPGAPRPEPVEWADLAPDALLQAAATSAPADAAARARLATAPSPAPTARAAALLALQDAAEAKRLGETALLALLVASETGKAARPGAPATLPPADRALIVRALDRTGFAAEARALAAVASPVP